MTRLSVAFAAFIAVIALAGCAHIPNEGPVKLAPCSNRCVHS